MKDGRFVKLVVTALVLCGLLTACEITVKSRWYGETAIDERAYSDKKK